VNQKIWIYGLIFFSITAVAKVPKKSRISFEPHVYLGVGAVDILKEKPPVFPVIHDEDETYTAINSLKSGGFFFQSQLRLTLIKGGPVSLGYAFWGQRVEYDNDYPELWFRTGTRYPLRFDLSFHAVCLQLASPRGFWSDHVMPFLVSGAGSFYGSSKDALYEYDSSTGWIWMMEEESKKYSGWGWMAGAGVEIYKYAYVYAGLTCFLKDNLPGRMFLDLIVGLKI